MKRTLFLALLACVTLGACAPMRVLRFKDPLTTQEHLQLGLMYEREGKFEAAEREYKAAVRREPEHLPALLALGNAQFGQEKFKEAEKTFKKSLKLFPGHPGASNNLAMTYVRTGRKLEQAEILALNAQADEAIRPYALDTLASVFLKRGKFEPAREALVEARRLAPPNDEAFLRHIDESDRRLQEAVEAARNEPGENP